MNFTRPKPNSVVQTMIGNWYDLNGNICRLFALLDAKVVAEIRKEKFLPMCLHDVPMHNKYFDANMGDITFQRVAVVKTPRSDG